MFDFVHRKKTIVQIILFLVMLPFLFWGIQSYRNESQSAVATVEGEEIPRWEFDQAMRNQHDRLRNMLKDNFNSAMLDSPEMRLAVLEGLIQQKIMHREAEEIGLTVLDSRLASEIQSISAFHDENGKFSYQRYEELLRRQQMTPVIFEDKVGAEILQQQLLEPLSSSAMVADAIVQAVIRLSEVKREINQVEIAPDQYLSEVNPDEDAIKTYYDQHQAEFLLPERVRIEYLVLSLNDLARQETVTSEEVRNYYEDHQSDYGQPEERLASHILIAVKDTTSEEAHAEAKRKVEDILAQVTQDPDKFAELAKEFSDDSGSAKSGGELGFLGKGVLVKEFEDALFQMEPNEIRGPVETAFGFHIIKLSEIKPAQVAPVEEVEDSIEEMLKRQKITSRFGEIAEEFSNIVYEQSDSLLPAADRFNLTVKQSDDWINKKSREPVEIANEKLMQALFSEDVIKEGRNTDAIEVMPDTFVSARVLEHKPATAQSLEVVRDQIVEKLKLQLAAEKTVEEGSDKLARLIAGETDLVDWGDTPKTVSYMQSQGLDIETLRAIFQADVTQLPTYVGVTNLQGKYNLVRINQVIEPDAADKEKLQSFSGQLKQMLLQEELAAYQASLRQRYSVKIRPESY